MVWMEFFNLSRPWPPHLRHGHIQAYLGGQLWQLLQMPPALGMALSLGRHHSRQLSN